MLRITTRTPSLHVLGDWRLTSTYFRREIGVLGLEQESVEPAAVVHGPQRIGRHTHPQLRPSASEISVTLRRFGMNRRLVLILEWLYFVADQGLLPGQIATP